MKLLLGLLVMIPIPTLFAAEAENEKHANFHKIECPPEAHANQCLKVDFPSDKTDDIALLEYVDGDITILTGHLMADAKQAISVTIYEEHMEITLHSPHDDEHSMFRVDLESGLTSVINMPTGIIFDDGPIAPDEINNATETGHAEERQLTGRSIPSKGYNLRVAVFYDYYFLQFNGNNHATAESRVASIFNHVKTIFSQLTVSGVTGAIVPSLHSTTYKYAGWTADNSLSTCSMISNNLQWDVDEHVYLTYHGSARGIVGMAWVRSTCSIYQYYRSNINEWYQTDTITAQIVAHEIGHNLGMFHDFSGSNKANRYENGELCTNIGGYMDYTTTPNKWSPCSVGDFTRYHSAVSYYRPNDGHRPSHPFCLQESTEGGGSTCIEDCKSSWTGAIPTCVTQDIKTSACTEACSQGTCS